MLYFRYVNQEQRERVTVPPHDPTSETRKFIDFAPLSLPTSSNSVLTPYAHGGRIPDILRSVAQAQATVIAPVPFKCHSRSNHPAVTRLLRLQRLEARLRYRHSIARTEQRGEALGRDLRDELLRSFRGSWVEFYGC